MALLSKKILIIEDEKNLCDALSKMLSHRKFETIQAFDGEQGLQEAEKNRPYLIILDLLLPKADGLTVLKKLRESEWGKEVKVLVLSNLVDTDILEETKKYNVLDYLVKVNWDLNVIGDKIESLLNSG